MERLKEKILALYITYKELISLLSEEHLHIEVGTDLPNRKKEKKMGKDMNKQFTKICIKMALKHMKRYLISNIHR